MRGCQDIEVLKELRQFVYRRRGWVDLGRQGIDEAEDEFSLHILSNDILRELTDP